MFHIIDPRKKNNNPPPPEAIELVKEHSNYQKFVEPGHTVQLHMCNVCAAFRKMIHIEYDGKNEMTINEFSPCPKCDQILRGVGPIMECVSKMIAFQVRMSEIRNDKRKDVE